jgi:ABC-2 type transport system permease protein
MTAPVWLIAEREVRTYVATVSFWAALAIGPLVAGGVLLVSGEHDNPSPVTIRAGDAQLAQSAAMALEQAGRLEGRHYEIGKLGAHLVLSNIAPETIGAEFSAGFPLSPTGRLLVVRTLERDAARQAIAIPSLVVREISAGPEPHGPDANAVSRFALMMMLWLTLTGSLGMLLQAVVRERASRALESLLAAARPLEILGGKLAGVGAISLLVLAAWLGSAAALSKLLPRNTGVSSIILTIIATPAMLLRTAVIYLLAYIFYGSLTIALGAMARDVTSAQNLSRPMFVLLLVAFFVALTSVSTGSTASLYWLAWLAPFTPFVLLLSPPGAIGFSTQIIVLALLLIVSLGVTRFAASRLRFSHP